MASPLTVVWPVIAGLLAGLLGAVVMNVPMGLLSEGYTPAYVAGGVLRGRDPDTVGPGLAVAVHHVAGILIGGGFVFTELYLETLMPGLVALPVAGLVTGAFVYDVFSLLVLPRTRIPSERRVPIRRRFGVSTTVYAVVLTVAFPVLVSLA